jgi:hypothetical protein
MTEKTKRLIKEGTAEAIKTLYDTIWVYSYETEIQKLSELYEKAKKEQWNASQDIDWSQQVDIEKLTFSSQLPQLLFQGLWEKLDDKKRLDLSISNMSWILSQILHGEQGALLVASHLVGCAPVYDEKLVASTQVIDEARHVEVFHKYLTTKLEKEFPISPHLRDLMRNILSESRWYFKFVGMQILVEGLAMGILFAYEGCVALKNRITDMSQVWEDVGLPVKETQEIIQNSPIFQEFLLLMFSRVVPNLKKLGILPDYMRPHYEELGILKFEDFEDNV